MRDLSNISTATKKYGHRNNHSHHETSQGGQPQTTGARADSIGALPEYMLLEGHFGSHGTRVRPWGKSHFRWALTDSAMIGFLEYVGTAFLNAWLVDAGGSELDTSAKISKQHSEAGSKLGGSRRHVEGVKISDEIWSEISHVSAEYVSWSP